MWRYLLIPLSLVCLSFQGTAEAAATLEGIQLGTRVSGPAVNPADFKGRVVLFEYWGVNCPPCLASIPHLTEWQKKYGRDRLIIIANQCQGADTEKAKSVFSSRGGSDQVSVINHGELSGANVSGIPRCFLFNHEGKMVYDGSPFELDAPLEQAIKNSPGFLVAGRSYQKTQKQAAVIGALQSNLTSTLGSLRTLAQGNDATAKEEAEYLLGKVDDYCSKNLKAITTDRTDNPPAAQAALTRMQQLFKGDKLGEPFETLSKELAKDKVFQAEIKADAMLSAVKAHADKINFGPQSAKQNRQAATQIAEALKAVVKKYPDTKAAKEATELAKSWQL